MRRIVASFAIIALAAILLFQLIPPATRGDPVGVKLVPFSELWSASIERQTDPTGRQATGPRLQLITRNAQALGIEEQLRVRTYIFLALVLLALYSSLPNRFRFLHPATNESDHDSSRQTISKSFANIISHPANILFLLLILVGLVVQNDLIDTSKAIPYLLEYVCSTENPCNVLRQPNLLGQF
ncbi:hypothetical protein [Methylobacterium sp. J-092]|uniref:hypothetical protein n=1 Tax=Methylobacterium sp. J-092 TaxID=2836667 RepID=UPI001FB8FDDC|nr:hypothetical protein [Methylobacterium sp. J-092]MCJ2005543.1 hypothetical protein [Methylobacterium sp. J-092]